MAKNTPSIEYEVLTDLNPEDLNAIGLEIFQMWLEFALGGISLGGNTIQHPTGRYASSIKMVQKGPSAIAIIADENVAPEADILETGHGPVDLKKIASLRGRTLPMYRGAMQSAPIAQRRRQSARSIWAQVRGSGFNGFATVPSKITAENASSWIIPAMPAYSPAAILAQLAAERFR